MRIAYVGIDRNKLPEKKIAKGGTCILKDS